MKLKNLGVEEKFRRVLYKITHEESYPYTEAIKKLIIIIKEELSKEK